MFNGASKAERRAQRMIDKLNKIQAEYGSTWAPHEQEAHQRRVDAQYDLLASAQRDAYVHQHGHAPGEARPRSQRARPRSVFDMPDMPRVPRFEAPTWITSTPVTFSTLSDAALKDCRDRAANAVAGEDEDRRLLGQCLEQVLDAYDELYRTLTQVGTVTTPPNSRRATPKSQPTAHDDASGVKPAKTDAPAGPDAV